MRGDPGGSGRRATPPWHREPEPQLPGVPAWGVPTSTQVLEALDSSLFPQLTPQWAWEGSTGAGVRVCIMDSGVEAGHPLVGPVERSVVVVEEPSGLVRMEDSDPVDFAGHGTACASVVRAIAPDVSLSSVKVLTDGKYGSAAGLLAGLQWAIAEGFDVINLSVSTRKAGFQTALYEAADAAYFRRCALVVAANNAPVRGFPWTFASVFSVAAHDERDAMAHFYNPTPPVEFLARGVGVDVAWLGGGRMRLTGNSFAAPHIVGKCALILAKHPWLTPFQLKSVLYHTAENVAAGPNPPRGQEAP